MSNKLIEDSASMDIKSNLFENYHSIIPLPEINTNSGINQLLILIENNQNQNLVDWLNRNSDKLATIPWADTSLAEFIEIVNILSQNFTVTNLNSFIDDKREKSTT